MSELVARRRTLRQLLKTEVDRCDILASRQSDAVSQEELEDLDQCVTLFRSDLKELNTQISKLLFPKQSEIQLEQMVKRDYEYNTIAAKTLVRLDKMKIDQTKEKVLVQQSNLCEPAIEVFDRTREIWLLWKSQFDREIHHNSSISTDRKFTYLLSL